MQRTKLRDQAGDKLMLREDGRAASFAEVIAAWRGDAEFRSFFILELAATEFPAFFWEMPPIRRERTDMDYECVVIRSDSLARMPPDAEAFASKFGTALQSVVTFRNLGGDALLVVPRPLADPDCYAHFAAFVRTAPKAQQHELFEALARAIDAELQRSAERIWISTSGLGVAWLHIRLDSWPKYYQHQPYALA